MLACPRQSCETVCDLCVVEAVTDCPLVGLQDPKITTALPRLDREHYGPLSEALALAVESVAETRHHPRAVPSVRWAGKLRALPRHRSLAIVRSLGALQALLALSLTIVTGCYFVDMSECPLHGQSVPKMFRELHTHRT